MATWVVGDIQGCFDSLLRWLERVAFDPKHDRLLLVGDLVNRGPKNLEVLRWVREHEDVITCVLGNHDLHLLCCHAGVTSPREHDTIIDVLDASDADELVDWLRTRPLLFHDDHNVLVHAGVHPTWSLQDAKRRANAAESYLRSDDYADLLSDWRSKRRNINDPNRLEILESLDVLTRMRTFRAESGKIDFSFSGSLVEMPGDLIPWFRRDPKIARSHTVFFGHWSAIGYHEENNTIATDSGCVWKRYLTGYRLDDGTVFSQPCVDFDTETRRRI